MEVLYFLVACAAIIAMGLLVEKYQDHQQIKDVPPPDPSKPERQLTDQEILDKKCHDYLKGNHW